MTIACFFHTGNQRKIRLLPLVGPGWPAEHVPVLSPSEVFILPPLPSGAALWSLQAVNTPLMMPYSHGHVSVLCRFIQAHRYTQSARKLARLLHVLCTVTALLLPECVFPAIKTPPQVVVESVGINEQHYICKLRSRLTPAAMWMDHLSDAKQLMYQSKAVLMAPGVDENYMLLEKTL